jgi:uncharacterized protein
MDIWRLRATVRVEPDVKGGVSVLKKFAFLLVGVSFVVLAATTHLAGQAAGGQKPGAGGATAKPAAAKPAAPAAPAPAAQPAGRPPAPTSSAGGTGGQGGNGPIKVLVITKGHAHERGLFGDMLDWMGNEITWTAAEHPAADVLMSPKYGKMFDVYLFYDLGGPGGPDTTPDGKKVDGFLASNKRTYPYPDPQLKTDFRDLLRAGKGMVFLHHAAAAWAHTWPEYAEVVGGACDWYANNVIRGEAQPNHRFAGNTPQHITFLDRNSVFARGIENGIDIQDEAYVCAYFEDSVFPVARTDYMPADPEKNLGPKFKYTNMTAWVKVSENSPVFYTEPGHDGVTFGNPGYRQLVLNAIKWAASPQAMAWAKANPTRIFQ